MELFSDYTLAGNGRTFAVSAENPTGEKGGGSRGSDLEKLRPAILIQPGEEAVIMDMDGPGYVTQMWFGGDVGTCFILRIYYENEAAPSVEAPACAFFGYPFGDVIRDVNGKFPALNSALLHAAPCRGFSCAFRMPYRKHIRITLENRSASAKWSYYTIMGLQAPVPESALYFHASYRAALPLARGKAYTVIDGIEGKGRFLGMVLGAGVNAPNGCWVEGEAKIYLDGDEYPSLNYTGTEDYFCGSFAFGYDTPMDEYQTYSHLYTGMYAMLGGTFRNKSLGTYNVQPRFMAYRWHLPDPVYFEKDFRMTLQNIGFRDGKSFGRRDDFVSVAYWYQTHPFKAYGPLPDDSDIFG